jgi:predicted nucleic acid-binding protein
MKGGSAMKTYWDSSALLNALASRRVYDRLDSSENLTRSHGYVEVFSHLSGRGLPMKDGTRQKVSSADAARMIDSLSKRFAVRDLTAAETLAVISSAETAGVQGARIHDLLHAASAKLSGAEVILTRDKGFASLGQGIKAEWP